MAIKLSFQKLGKSMLPRLSAKISKLGSLPKLPSIKIKTPKITKGVDHSSFNPTKFATAKVPKVKAFKVLKATVKKYKK